MTAMAGLTFQVDLWLILLHICTQNWSVQRCFVLFLLAASGDSSMERDFSGGLGGPTVSTPNSKENSPSRSLSGQ